MCRECAGSVQGTGYRVSTEGTVTLRNCSGVRCLTSSLSDLDVNLVSALDSLLPSMNDVNVCNPNTLKSTVGIPIANNLEALTLLITQQQQQ